MRPKNTATCGCSENCGAPVYARNLGRNCYQRAWEQGFPSGGPRPPVPPSEAGRRSGAARRGLAGEADAYDINFARQRRAARSDEADERLYRAGRFAADMARAIQSRDLYGWRTLWARMTDPNAVITALCLCVPPELLMAGPDEPERSERSA